MEHEYCWRTAEALNHETGETECRFDKKDFGDIPLGSDFSQDEKWKPVAITPEEIPVIIKADQEERAAKRAEVLRVREAKLATGRFIITEDEKGVLEREILTDRLDRFWEALLWRFKNDPWHQPYYQNLTLEVLKADPRHQEFMSHAREGDRLEYQEWNGGFLAAAGEFVIVRDGENYAHYTWWVS